MIKATDDHSKFLRRMNILLHVILFIMIAGFFTWSENVAITRVIKVISRVGMTVWIFLLYKEIINYGAVGSFKWRNIYSPLLYGAYLFLALVSFFWSTDVGYSALQLIMDLESLLFSFFFIKSLMLLETYFPGNSIRFYNLMGNVAFIILLIFVVGGFVNEEDFYRAVEGGESLRMGGYIMNPNELGMYCGLGISCLIFDIYRKKSKWWTFIKISVMLYALIMTKSRSSLIGLLLIVFFHIRNANNRKLEFAVYIAMAGILPIAVENMLMRKGGIDELLSMTGRMPFWKALVLEGLPREPLFGFGFMRIDYKDHFESVHTYAGHMTHNTFMQVLMNLGFVGLMIALTQLFFTVRGFLNEEKEKKLMLIGILIPVIINSFTEFGIFGETNYGILFYQLLIFYISVAVNTKLTPGEIISLKVKRPDIVQNFLKVKA
jgi:exopolysaccharide production protein ExoQ